MNSKEENPLFEVLEEKFKSSTKRDFLRQVEQQVQAQWELQKAFESNPSQKKEKYFVTFPYPYMNGKLHLGHVFTLSKADFLVYFERLQGKNTLFPFAFHCTGMPIKACADKLKREFEIYGKEGPPKPSQEEIEEMKRTIKENLRNELTGKKNNTNLNCKSSNTPITTFRSQKSKASAKSSASKTQWEIMRSLGLNDEEILKFIEPTYWLQFFPPICKENLTQYGACIDWRRSFITTSENPYYDSFIRWQFNKLKELGKIKFGKRYSIYSALDAQPCLDHDRSSGENVQPQEYVLIKMKVESKIEGLEVAETMEVFLVAATLRPETMYGQTNCWVKPAEQYAAFQINEKEIFICSERAARNLSFQGFSPLPGQVQKICDINGSQLIGVKVNAPLSFYGSVYTLPMLSISLQKGTGIVTSVPSDSPDDYAALRDLQLKSALREKYGVKEEWVNSYQPVGVIRTSISDLTAPYYCDLLKIKSQNDEALLLQAKERCYTLGYYEGYMLQGEYVNQRVEDVKEFIKEKLIRENQALLYCEPESEVISRSGDSCVVALVDQWFINYDNSQWKEQTKSALDKMNTYHPETRHMFENTLKWLNQWACSRSFGLGTRIPWDEQYLIESLSDSTIYMAYYTIAHYLQSDPYGKTPGPFGILPEQLTTQVWDYIFLTPAPGDLLPAGIPNSLLDQMREEFRYWYPLDLRVSGKDLVPNHLTFSLYNHVAIWNKEELSPLAFRANGHLLLNGSKMSKNTGNFLTLSDSLELFGADATRFALADSGDSLEDANFSSNAANKAVLHLYNSIAWANDILSSLNHLTDRDLNSCLADRIFNHSINEAIDKAQIAYKSTEYRDALFYSYFFLKSARDEYLNRIEERSQLNRTLIVRYLEVHTLLMLPITPHYAEKIWSLLRKDGLAVNARWPTLSEPVDHTLLDANRTMHSMMEEFRKKIANTKTKVSKGRVSVAKSYPTWHYQTLQYLSEQFATFSDHCYDQNFAENTLKSLLSSSPQLKAHSDYVAPLVRNILEKAKLKGRDAFSCDLPYDEKRLYIENLHYLQKSLRLELSVVDEEHPGESKASAVPHRPVITLT